MYTSMHFLFMQKATKIEVCLSAMEFSGKITEHQSEKTLNISNDSLAGDKVASSPHICNQAEEDCAVTVPHLEEGCGNRSDEILQLSLPFDSEVVRDNGHKIGGNVKQSEKMLYLNPNLVTHVNLDDPARGRKLNYEELEDRMKTFKLPPQWEGPVDYQSMAEAGFVYTGQEDLVYCFSCNVKLDKWSKDMEPLLRHKEESPTCSFLRQKLQAVKKGKTKSVVAPSKPLNSRLTSSIGELQSSSLITSKAIHAVVTGLNEPRLSYGGSSDDRPGAFLPITPENYQSEAERIKSFVGWPLNETVHPEQLARVGFVYTGDGALVQCFQCGVKYRHWYKGDVPLNVHQKCNPRCPFLQTLTSKSKSSLPEHQPTSSYIQPESIGSSSTQGEEVNKYSLQFPEYSKETIRMQSFKHWGGVVPAKELAEAGFYMIARRDVVRCFSCNVVVQDWERSDNVIDEHRRHSPDCSFLKQTFQLSKSSDVLSPYPSIDKTNQHSIENSMIRSKDNQSIQLPSAMEPSNSDIRLPPSMKSRGSSNSPDDTQEEAIPGIRYPPSWGQHRSMSPQGASKKISEGSDESFHSAESHHGADYNILSSIDPPKTKIMVSLTRSL